MWYYNGLMLFFFFSSRRRHTRSYGDWSSDVCSSDLLSGRYARGGRGVVRLKGKMSGRDFVREIPVELPETEERHDVLATLWARRRVDELMGRDMHGLQTGNVSDELSGEITRLGLDFR